MPAFVGPTNNATEVGALLMVRTHTGLATWDPGAARFGADHATARSTSVLRDLTQLGGTAGVLIAGRDGVAAL